MLGSQTTSLFTAVTLSFALSAVACSGGDGTTGGAGADGGTATGTGTTGTGGGLNIGAPTGTATGDPNDKPPAEIIPTLPLGFTGNPVASGFCGKTPTGDDYPCQPPKGGFMVLGNVNDFTEEASNSCRNVLRGIVRDFPQVHPDFFGDADGQDLVNPNLVAPVLDPGTKKPIGGGGVPAPLGLGDWFVNEAGGNTAYVVDFWFEPVGDTGVYIFDSSRFFPVDGQPSQDVTHNGNDNLQHNFLFTTEIHTAFEYQEGQVFTFRGDDDVWVYINNQLVVDLGGVHSAKEATANLSGLGLTPGQLYSLDLYQAERNPTGSNFRIETTLDFQECGLLETDIPTVK